MNIVAIETATETVAVAVRTSAGVQAELALTGRRRHVEALTPALEHVLAQVALAATDIDAVAVDIGPGLFTGLRVGVAAAKGLAQALGVGVVTATSLDILVAGAEAAGHAGPVLAAVDARRGEVFATLRGPGGLASTVPSVPLIPAALFEPGALADAVRALGVDPIVAVGDGAQRYREMLGTVDGLDVVGPALSFPPPAVLLDLAVAKLEGGETPVAPASVVPLYMREADAKSNFERAARA